MQPVANYVSFIWNKTGLIITILFAAILTIWTIAPTQYQSVSDIREFASARLRPTVPKHWPGWTGIKHMVVFGDSYTATGFKGNRGDPNEDNPFGNPEWPGDTSSGAANWIDFLVTSYNQTFIKAVNFAQGGATVDGDLIRQYVPIIHSFKTQVQKDYKPQYSSGTPEFDWEAGNTLFAMFFGINDLNNAWQDKTADWALKQDIAQYACLVDEVYQTGARNFLFMNVPPFDRSPLLIRNGPQAVSEERKLINDFNADISRMASNLTRTYDDVTTFIFDTHAVYSQVLNNPCSHAESCALLNTTSYCPGYETASSAWEIDTFIPDCGVSVDKYFWLNPLHPTYRIHDVTAKEVAKHLSRQASNDH